MNYDANISFQYGCFLVMVLLVEAACGLLCFYSYGYVSPKSASYHTYRVRTSWVPLAALEDEFVPWQKSELNLPQVKNELRNQFRSLFLEEYSKNDLTTDRINRMQRNVSPDSKCLGIRDLSVGLSLNRY